MPPASRREGLLVVASLVAGFVALELGLRVAAYLGHRQSFERAINDPPPLGPDRRASLGHLLRPSWNPRLVYELRPRLSVLMTIPRGPEAWVHTNSRGFRDGEHPIAKAAGVHRILGVGDSLMFGWGVQEGQDYLSVVERRLQQEHPEGSWEVINTAVPGYNTVMEIESLKARGLEYRPDLVIVGYCGNDLGLPNFIWPDASYLSLRTSLLKRFVGERLGRWKAPPPPNAFGSGMQNAPLRGDGFEDDPERVPPQYRDMVGWDPFARSLRELQQLGHERGFRGALLLFFGGGEPNRDRVVEQARSLGLALIDVGAAQERFMRENGVKDFYGSALTVGPGDAHPSALSHRLAAATVLDWMRSQDLIRPGS